MSVVTTGDGTQIFNQPGLMTMIRAGHSTGGDVAPPTGSRSAVPPLMLMTEVNPGGLPIAVFDGFRQGLAANRARFSLDAPTGTRAYFWS